MATTLKALTTLSLERGRVAPGQVFVLHNKHAAQELIEAGLAEASADEVKDEAKDAKPDTTKLSISSPKPPKADKPADNDAK